MGSRILTLALAVALAFLAVASVQVCVMPEAAAAPAVLPDCHGAPPQTAPVSPVHDCADHGDACMVDMQVPSLQPLQSNALDSVPPLSAVVAHIQHDASAHSSLGPVPSVLRASWLAFSPPPSSITILRI